MNINKYKILYSKIINSILNNEWPDSLLMKSENELTSIFKVSRLNILFICFNYDFYA